jgi:hypothetical protein
MKKGPGAVAVTLQGSLALEVLAALLSGTLEFIEFVLHFEFLAL